MDLGFASNCRQPPHARNSVEMCHNCQFEIAGLDTWLGGSHPKLALGFVDNDRRLPPGILVAPRGRQKSCCIRSVRSISAQASAHIQFVDWCGTIASSLARDQIAALACWGRIDGPGKFLKIIGTVVYVRHKVTGVPFTPLAHRR